MSYPIYVSVSLKSKHVQHINGDTPNVFSSIILVQKVSRTELSYENS